MMLLKKLNLLWMKLLSGFITTVFSEHAFKY